MTRFVMLSSAVDESDDDAFFAAIGWFTVAWALLEASVDYACSLIYDRLGGDQFEKERPRNMKGKLRFLLRASRKIEALQPFPSFGPLVREIESAVVQGAKRPYPRLHHWCQPDRRHADWRSIRFIQPGNSKSEMSFTITAASAKNEALRAMRLARRFSQTVKGDARPVRTAATKRRANSVAVSSGPSTPSLPFRDHVGDDADKRIVALSSGLSG